jgi:plasmid stabilization system protein ParE
LRENVAVKPLDWTRTARRQYLAQLDWIAQYNLTAALSIQQKVEHSLQLVQEQPDLGTPDQKGRRRYPVPRTPLLFYYRVTPNRIHILRVMRQEQDYPFANKR